MHNLPVFIYDVTKTVSFPEAYAGVATLLPAKNTLCIARNDAQLALYDTTDLSEHAIVETPSHEYACHRGFARDSRVRYDVGILMKRQFSDHPVDQRWQQQLLKSMDGALKKAAHSHDDMRPSAMTSNALGNIVCMAKTIDDCSALEIYTICGKTADELTLKRTIPCDGYFAITDLAYTPNQTCVSIAHDAIKEWDALTGKAIRIEAQRIPKPKLDFLDQSSQSVQLDSSSPDIVRGSYLFGRSIGTMLGASSDTASEKRWQFGPPFKAPYGKEGRLLPIGRNILVSASDDMPSHSGSNYIAMLDMRAKHILCNAMKIESWHVYDMAQSPSENCFLTGGDEGCDVCWNNVKEWDWRKIGSSTNSEDKPKPVRTFDTKVEWKIFSTIRTLANHKNNILAIVTQQNEVQENGTFLQVWDSTKYKSGENCWNRPNNYPAQTIKISDFIEPNAHISVLEDDRVLVAGSQGLTELTLASS